MAPVRERCGSRGGRSTVAALGAAAVLALTAACVPLGPFGGPTDAATPDRPLSTAATDPGQASVLGSGVPEPEPTTPFPAPATIADPYWNLTPPPVVTATPTPTATASGTPGCDLRTRRTVPFQAVGAPGQATLSWYSHGGGSLRGWRVAVVPQQLVSGDQPPLRWQDVAAPDGCVLVSTTITGLASGQTYSFWLHAQIATPLDPGGTLEMVGRTTPLVVP
ncbi:fibronectin type III domain-containing protein [Streptomyces sp. NP160]|uniref:fibronectin type III domain-containing protein n=1 Tax=Streptomyces sp. NP160 TaxID=2586637 RepID=UPI00111B804C|nr:fibronectin type III domain-containing protein [Streptomyces sp. NP160]TNM70216.1 fibronectin type III domain-containing protein [Streptomyces sp. NP160]